MSPTWAAAQPPPCSPCLHLCSIPPGLCTEPQGCCQNLSQSTLSSALHPPGLLITFKSLDNQSLPSTPAILGFHALLSLSLLPRRHANHSPTTGSLPTLCPLPGILFSRYPFDLASFRSLLKCHCASIFYLHTWIYSTPISTLLCPPGADYRDKPHRLLCPLAPIGFGPWGGGL